jgi:ankyrin repeat protein
MRAAHAEDGEVVEVLLEHAAQLDLTAKYGLIALMLAIVSGHIVIARALAREGADLSLRGSGAPGFAGKTAHDLAIDQGLDEIAQELSNADTAGG